METPLAKTHLYFSIGRAAFFTLNVKNMKHFFMLLLNIVMLNVAHSQNTCQTVGAEVTYPPQQNGQYNTFGVRVTIEAPYSQNIIVNGTMHEDEGGNPGTPWSLTISAGQTSAETSTTAFQYGPASGAVALITSVSPCPVFTGIFVNGNRIKFNSLDRYEEYADGIADANVISITASSDGNVTTLEEQNNPADSLYPDFIKQIANSDHIVQVGDFLLKFDLENQRVLVINETENGNAYSELVSNNLSADGMMNFDTDVVNGVDVLRLIQNGSINSSNYQSALDRSTTKVQFKIVPNTISSQFALASMPELVKRNIYKSLTKKFGVASEDKKTSFIMWREETGFSDCWDNKRWLLADNKVVYQAAVFYFSLQAKIKTMWACTNTNFIMIPSYDANLRLQGTAKYRRKGSNSDVNLSQNDADFHRVLNWRAYSNSRSLTRYDFTVTFSAKRQQDANFEVFPVLRIVKGY